jgi:hypothetical protein
LAPFTYVRSTHLPFAAPNASSTWCPGEAETGAERTIKEQRTLGCRSTFHSSRLDTIFTVDES